MSYTPSAYATAAELQAALGYQANTLMTDFGEEEAVVEMDRILLENSAMIDSMIGGRVAVPVAGGSALLKRIAITVSKFDIWSRQASADVPEALKNDYAAQMKVLERIAKGEITFASETPEYVEGEFTSTTRVIDAGME